MAKARLITGFDIGTASVKALVALKQQGSSDFQIISQIEEPCLGVRRGVVIDPDEVSQIVSSVLAKVQEKTSHPSTGKSGKINSAYVNIGGSHIFITPSHGEVAVSRADQKISQEDVERVLQAAQTFPLPVNKEILDVFPKEFIVDGERGLKEVLGMQGVKLEADIFALCAFSPYYKNLTQALLNAGLHVDDIIASPLASARAVLSLRQKELGVAVLDIGAGTSDLAVFEERDLIHTAVLPIGSAHITSDIAIGLQTDIDTAERIKKEFGSCVLGKTIEIEIPQDDKEEPLVVPQKLLVKIIEARVSDIFEQTEKELKKISRQALLPAGIVLTGGGSKLPGIVEFAKKKLKLPAQLGQIQDSFTGLQLDPSLATVCGLILQAADTEDEPPFLVKGIFSNIFSKLKKTFRIFIP